jgi:hypothetical protein
LAEQVGDGRPPIGVEIVRRLVHQQNVGLLQQHGGKPQPGPFAATERRYRAARIEAGQTDLRQRLVDSRFQRPVGQPGVLDAARPRFEPPQSFEISGDAERFRQRLARVLHLAQRGDPASARYGAGSRLALAREDCEQGGLARSVAPDKPNDIVAEREAEVCKKLRAVRGGGGNAICRQECGHGRTRAAGNVLGGPWPG